MRSSILISELVKHLAPDDPKALDLAVDIIRKYPTSTNNYDKSVFLSKWSLKLQNNGKYDTVRYLQHYISFLTQKLKYPQSLLFFFDKLDAKSDLISLNSSEKLYPSISTGLPRAFIFVLMGLESQDFKWSEERGRFVYTRDEYFHISKRVAQIGCDIKFLSAYITSKESLVQQHMIIIIREILDSYFLYISQIDQHYEEMSESHFYDLLLSKEIEEIRAAVILTNSVSLLKGGNLLNTLTKISTHGDPTISTVAKRMCDKCMVIIEQMIKLWVTSGEINDPYNEFFIAINPEIYKCSEWWKERYKIISSEIPALHQNDFIKKIKYTGKISSFIRAWDQAIDFKIDQTLQLHEYVDAIHLEAERQIIQLFRRDDQLFKAIQDIHDYILLQRGDFASSFLELDQIDISSKLQYILEKFSSRTMTNIDFTITDDNWQFVYNAFPPISAILGPKQLKVYKSVSLVLLRIKRTEYALVNASRKASRIQLVLIYEMLTFVKLVMEFLNLQIIHKSYTKLIQTFDDFVSFKIIRKKHKEHISNISRGCWVTTSGKECKEKLFQLLENIENNLIQVEAVRENMDYFHRLLQGFQNNLLKNETSGYDLGRTIQHVFGRIMDKKDNSYDVVSQDDVTG